MRDLLRAVDLFAGVGGSTTGAKAAGFQVVAAVDAWKLACESYSDNHPEVRVHNEACEKIDPKQLSDQFGPIDLLLASPECTSHTCAKGSAERSERSRCTAFQVARYAAALKPRWIVVENVIHMRTWPRYQEFLDDLAALGYRCSPLILNSAHFGVPQSRRRLFIACEFGADPPGVVPPAGSKTVAARHIIDRNGTYRYSPLRAERRAPATIERADRATTAIGVRRPFLLVYYGTDGAGGWQSVNTPLRTITTLDRFAYVRPRGGMHEMRMLQVPELKLAMGFSAEYVLQRGTRRDRIKLLGNAVCPPVMAAIVGGFVSKAAAENRAAAGRGR